MQKSEEFRNKSSSSFMSSPESSLDQFDVDEGTVRLLGQESEPSYTEGLSYTHEEEKRIVRKVDRRIIIFLLLNVSLAAADKVSNGTASIYGLQQDLHLKGNQYSWIGSSFYCGYLLWSFPSALVLQKLPIAKLAGSCFMIWGVLIFAAGFSKNFATIVSIRALLGALEAPIVPINLIIISMWYSKNKTTSSDEEDKDGKEAGSGSEQSLRIGLFYTGLSGLITGPLGYAVGGIHDPGNKPWRYFFWILGCLSVVYGFLEFMLLPDSPNTASFLSKREAAIVIDRVRKNQIGFKNTTFKKEQFLQTLNDPKVWVMVLLQLSMSIPNGGLTNFSHLIISGLTKQTGDYNRTVTLLDMPGGMMQTISVYSSSGLLYYLEKNYPKRHFKGTLLCLFLVPAFIGTGLLYKLPQQYHIGRLFSLYFSFFYLGPYIISLNIITCNHAGFTRRITANALYFATYAISNLIAPQFFLQSQAPTYSYGVAAIFTAYFLTIVFTVVYMILCYKENMERDAIYGPVIIQNRDSDMQDITDIDNPNFRYKY